MNEDHGGLPQKFFGWNTWDTESVYSFVYLPYGLAVRLCFKDSSSDRVFRSFQISHNNEAEANVRPKGRSLYGEYIETELRLFQNILRIRFASIGKHFFLNVHPLAAGPCPLIVTVEVALLWGREGLIEKRGDLLTAKFPDGNRFVIHSTGTKTIFPYAFSHVPYLAFLLDQPILVSDTECSNSEMENIFSAACDKQDRAICGFGQMKHVAEAMKSTIAWDTIYDPERFGICTPVSRRWNLDWGGYVLFGWDTCFGALIASVFDTDLAQRNMEAILSTEIDGFVPNFTSANGDVSLDRSHPPVGSYCTLEIYKRSGDRAFLEQTFELLLRWNQWYFANRNSGNGYLCWGSGHHPFVHGKPLETHAIHTSVGASFESGMDLLPIYDDIPFDGEKSIMCLADLALMGEYILDCRSLAEIARILGKAEEEQKLIECKNTVEKAVLSMWSEEAEMFLNLRTDTGELSRRIAITNFLALLADGVTDEQKAKIAKRYFYNEEEFFGEYMMPVVSKRDLAYAQQLGFRGRIWPPLNFLVYRALRHAKMNKECRLLAEKSARMIVREWREFGHVHENYHAVTGYGCGENASECLYHWGALLGYIALEDFDQENRRSEL